MDLPEDPTAAEAAAVAVHKASSLQQAVEVARELQMQQVVEASGQRAKEGVIEGFREVFGNSDSENPQQMRVIVRKIPILCVNVEKTQRDISDIKDDMKELKDTIKDLSDNIDKKLDDKYVTKERFSSVEKLVFGCVALILVAFLGAVIALIIK